MRTLPATLRGASTLAAATLVAASLAACTGRVAAAADPTPDSSPGTSVAASLLAARRPTPVPGLATWRETGPTVASLDPMHAVVDLTAVRGDAVRVQLSVHHAVVTGLPGRCRPSTVVRAHSWISDGAQRLVCQVKPRTRHVVVPVLALGDDADRVGGAVTVTTGRGRYRGALPARTLLGGTHELTPDLRLLSSPDFLNADVADLRHGPGRWNPHRSTNGTSPRYERALDTVLDDWQRLDPAGVLVAGDLVDGRWGYDDHHTGTFGPVRTPAQRRAAVRRAARTYYPAWKQRFARHGLHPAPAVGDHEYGDDPWGPTKRALLDTFRSEFAREFTRRAGGRFVYPDHPRGRAAGTAWATRPAPGLQVVTIDPFQPTRHGMRLSVDRQQLRWLRSTLARARRDGVDDVVVQGHVPILWPVRTRGSSGLHYPGGERSALWRTFRRYGVDLYLCGEVHDTTASSSGGVVQVAHGGLFQFGLTTALVVDQYGDRLFLSLRDYDVRWKDAPHHRRLWETRRDGMPERLSVRGAPRVIGTAVVEGGRLRSPTGILRPQRHGRHG